MAPAGSGRPVSEFTVLPAGPRKQLCVQPNLIRDHARFGTEGPTITVVVGEEQLAASEVEIRGESRLIQSLQEPMSTGAKVWVETTAEVAYR